MLKPKAIVFGIGKRFSQFKSLISEEFNIIALVDNDVSKIGTVVGGIEIAHPNTVTQIDCDIIIITTNIISILHQLISLGTSMDKIEPISKPPTDFTIYVPGAA